MRLHSGFVGGCLRSNFLDMYEVIQTQNKAIKDKYGVEPPFGIFWNFCVNGPWRAEGINRVFCEPHVDAMNGAVMLCAVMVYNIGEGKRMLAKWRSHAC